MVNARCAACEILSRRSGAIASKYPQSAAVNAALNPPPTESRGVLCLSAEADWGLRLVDYLPAPRCPGRDFGPLLHNSSPLAKAATAHSPPL
jgi:hypothetical protein